MLLCTFPVSEALCLYLYMYLFPLLFFFLFAEDNHQIDSRPTSRTRHILSSVFLILVSRTKSRITIGYRFRHCTKLDFYVAPPLGGFRIGVSESDEEISGEEEHGREESKKVGEAVADEAFDPLFTLDLEEPVKVYSTLFDLLDESLESFPQPFSEPRLTHRQQFTDISQTWTESSDFMKMSHNLHQSQEGDFPNPWMISSTGLISNMQGQQGILTTTNTSSRSPPKICGLFDTGFAGDDHQIASTVPSAPANVLSEFDLGGHDSSITFTDPSHLSLYDDVAGSLNKQDPQLQSMTNADIDEDNWDLLDDLSADPLGDESLDAFINLDKYLTGNNSFFEEDVNCVQEPAEVNPVINIQPIQDLEQNVNIFQDLIDMVPGTVEMVECPPLEVSTVAESTIPTGKGSRKRKRNAKSDAVKTSLFEIQENNTSGYTTKNQVDHDYSAKRQKLIVETGADADTTDNTPTSMVTVLASVDDCDKISSTASTSKEDKQLIRRLKNNVASKRSREQRKQKFVDMDVEADELVVKNEELRKKIVELENLTKEMKTALIAKMVAK